ncbi:unnamed protein product, partial [marine sediment metagenome]
TKFIIGEEVKEIKVEYYTPAPLALEKNISKYKKQIIVYSDTHYDNILTYTSITESSKKAIKLYWLINGSRRLVTNISYIDSNNNSKIDRIEWITPYLSNQTYEVEITVLNVQSYPTIGGNWTVAFNTIGTADLAITAVNGTIWSNINEDNDLKFLEVRCGNDILEYEWINDSVFIENYECYETGYEISKVLTSGKHTLEFEFGSQTAYASNDASKGAISTTPGATPFYTINLNPQNCTLNAGQSCSLTWQVNATGALHTPFEFFGITSVDNTDITNVNSTKINITIAEMTISETLSPPRIEINENSSVYGYVNTSDGEPITNHNISIYVDDVRYYYNPTSGLLDTTSSGATTTNASGFYNYTFNSSTAGAKTIKVNATLNNIIGEQTAGLAVYSST